MIKNKQKSRISTLPVCLALPQDHCFTGTGSDIQTDQELRGRDKRGRDTNGRDRRGRDQKGRDLRGRDWRETVWDDQTSGEAT